MRPFLLLIAVLVTGCAIGPYAETPRYKLPETRAIAARHLNEALAFGAHGLSEVAADELKLTWNERTQLTGKRYVLLERELQFDAVQSVYRPEERGEWWELKVDATGGQLTFEFKNGPTASKAEAALKRLMQTD